jgi:hypothetical protein
MATCEGGYTLEFVQCGIVQRRGYEHSPCARPATHTKHETQGVAHALGRAKPDKETTVSETVKVLLRVLNKLELV